MATADEESMVLEGEEIAWGDDESPSPGPEDLDATVLAPLDDDELPALAPAPPPPPPPPPPPSAKKTEDWLAEIKRAYEASPHACAGGCGEKRLRPNEACELCALTKRDEGERRGRVESFTRRLPERYRWASFDAPELVQRVKDRTGVERARAACATGVDVLVFAGPASVGKTALATAATKLLCFERKLSALYVDSRSLSFARAQAPLGEEAAPVTAAFACGALLLDDLGLDDAVHNSPVADVVYRRYAECRLLVVTTTLSPAEAAAKFGDGISRRLFERVDSTRVVE
ncbi:MAG TPA: hypothetical protein VHS09_00830, partial [Polyangiaceae bacterium]|nr:hypothetical protein [Polyangiaceae bacterium]